MNPIPMPPPITTSLAPFQPGNINNNNTASLPASTTPNANPGNGPVPIVQPTSVINLTNSSDVVIGPMTQYQGAVTIYQYMDATVESSNRVGSANIGLRGNNANNTSVNSQSWPCKDIPNYVLVAIIFVIIILVGISVYFALELKQSPNEQIKKRDIFFGNGYDDETIPNLGNGHFIIDREQWGSKNLRKRAAPLDHPIPYVVITHFGVQSEPCDSVADCSIQMRIIQDNAVAEKEIPDVPANFYIGNDGYVYVGRGWNKVNSYGNHSLAVCFIGDYKRYYPGQKQLEAVQYLLNYGVTRNYLAPDYRLVAHNQTKTTYSPGSNVYREIIQWPHWYDCGMKKKIKCGEELGMIGEWDAKM